MKKLLQYKPLTKLLKNIFTIVKKTIRFIVSKSQEAYTKKPKTTTLIGVVLTLLLLLGGYLLYRHFYPRKIATIPYSFEEVTVNNITITETTTLNWGDFNNQTSKFPRKLEAYYTQVKPFPSLQEEETLEKLIKDLGFTDNVRQYATEESVTFQEAGKSLNMDLSGSYINYSIGLNVEEDVLKNQNTIAITGRTETANMFLTNYSFYPNYTDSTDPEMFFSKMEKLGLVEIADPLYADVTIYLYKNTLNDYTIEQSTLNTYIMISNSGKIVSFASNNKDFISQVSSPLKSRNQIKDALQNNQGVIIENISAELLKPQSITIKTIELVYYYNEYTQYASPVFKIEATVSSNEVKKDVIIYIEAYQNNYYTTQPLFIEDAEYQG